MIQFSNELEEVAASRRFNNQLPGETLPGAFIKSRGGGGDLDVFDFENGLMECANFSESGGFSFIGNREFGEVGEGG